MIIREVSTEKVGGCVPRRRGNTNDQGRRGTKWIHVSGFWVITESIGLVGGGSTVYLLHSERCSCLVYKLGRVGRVVG